MPFVLTTSYEIASEIAFYSKSGPELLCANLGDRRMNQYDIWGGWRNQRGKNALVVIKDPAEEPPLHAGFRSFQALPEALPVVFQEKTLRTFHFFTGMTFNGVQPPLPETR